MIANSHPTNPPSHQMQRCIGINQEQQQQQQQQQNSLYGVNMPPQASNSNLRPTSHMFDLANLQQQQQQQLQQQQQTNSSNLFDSAYDDATSSANHSDHLVGHSNHSSNNATNNADMSRLQMINNSSNNHKQQVTNDMSLYSPSSSTSLLYHVYDQINVPNEHHHNQHHHHHQQQQQQQASNQQQQQNFKRSNTTILNPANLFASSSTTMASQQHAANGQANFALNNGASKTTIAQQELYSSGAQFHLQQPSFNNNNNSNNNNNNGNTMHNYHPHTSTTYGLDNHHQLMLDTILRQQHAVAANKAQQQAQQQHQQHYHNRPLSSSGASSMSGQSMALTYGRQTRQANLPPLPPINSSKSQNTLASVLQSNQTLNHLGLSLNGHLTSATMDTRGPKKLGHHHHHLHHQQFPTASSSSGSSAGGACAGAAVLTSRKWKRAQQRVRHFAYEYSAILKCSMLLILLAFSLMSIIKFALLNNSQSSLTSSQASQNPIFDPLPSFFDIKHNGNQSPNKLGEPINPLSHLDLPMAPGAAGMPSSVGMDPSLASTPDMLKSKFLIGRFVILNQNYSQSSAQRALLAENIVKLMDQVFLSTDMRSVYHKMDVTDIKPSQTSSGIIVSCNIILRESITYAAPQFGLALYHSLAKSNEKLANHASFIIDKSSIRFNTVPDDDLDKVPPELIPPFTFPRPDSPSHMTPSSGLGPKLPIDNFDPATTDNRPAPQEQPTAPLDEGAVAWSAWSQWSSCVDKNGICDPQRLHSRLRKCFARHTGEKVDALQCRQRFSMQDQELEVADCSMNCANSGSGDATLSDAPISPLTAPSVMVESPPSFLLPSAHNGQRHVKVASQAKMSPASSATDSSDIYALANTPLAPLSSSTTQPSAGGTGGSGGNANGGHSTPASIGSDSTSSSSSSNGGGGSSMVANIDLNQHQQQQTSCSNCTSDEICLMLEKVPFCAKIKDRADETGCGGWCKKSSQFCQTVGQNAFKCINDSECLPNEWRCLDSQCIPMSKRCDGHGNCFDNSDELNCPAR